MRGGARTHVQYVPSEAQPYMIIECERENEETSELILKTEIN